MPRSMIERTFPGGLAIPMDDVGAGVYLQGVEHNAEAPPPGTGTGLAGAWPGDEGDDGETSPRKPVIAVALVLAVVFGAAWLSAVVIVGPDNGLAQAMLFACVAMVLTAALTRDE
jgi:hypothetical protein